MQIRSYLLAGAALFALSACGTVDHEAAWESSGAREARAEAHEGERETLLRKAEQAWAERDDAEKTLEAIRAYRDAVEIDPNDVDTLVKLAHAEYYYADCHLSFDEEDEEAYKQMLQSSTKSAEYSIDQRSEGFTPRCRMARVMTPVPGPSSRTGRPEAGRIGAAMRRAVTPLVGSTAPTALGPSIHPLKKRTSSSKRWASFLRS